MSVSCTIAGQLIEVAFTGATGHRELYDFFFRLSKDPDCPAQADLLMDTSGSTSRDSRTLDTLKGVADFIFKALPYPKFDRVAVVVPEPSLDRYDDLTSSVAEETGIRIRTFPDADTAREWLTQRTD